MALELLVNAGAIQTRIAWVRDGVLERLEVANIGDGAQTGALYLGRVTRVMAAMQAAFVDIGQTRDGFLSLRDAPAPVREGDALAVQVIRAAAGEKGPRLSARCMLTPPQEDLRKAARPPALLGSGPGALERALRDAPGDAAILIDDARAHAAAHKAFPHLSIELAKEDLFARHDLEEQVAVLAGPRAALPCGGWITIEATEALTAIDVNSGSFIASGGRSETARTVNLEAAREAARQIVLRGIGGLIVVDFIQMEDAAHGRDVVTALRRGLAQDKVAVEVSPVTGFGIVAIARQRTGPSPLHNGPCESCGGGGQRAVPADIAQEILRAVERAARAAPGREIVVRAAPPVADWLAAHAQAVRAGLDRRGVGRVRYISEARRREDFDVGTG